MHVKISKKALKALPVKDKASQYFRGLGEQHRIASKAVDIQQSLSSTVRARAGPSRLGALSRISFKLFGDPPPTTTVLDDY